jgi:hypothetical protein
LYKVAPPVLRKDDLHINDFLFDCKQRSRTILCGNEGNISENSVEEISLHDSEVRISDGFIERRKRSILITVSQFAWVSNH